MNTFSTRTLRNFARISRHFQSHSVPVYIPRFSKSSLGHLLPPSARFSSGMVPSFSESFSSPINTSIGTSNVFYSSVSQSFVSFPLSNTPSLQIPSSLNPISMSGSTLSLIPSHPFRLECSDNNGISGPGIFQSLLFDFTQLGDPGWFSSVSDSSRFSKFYPIQSFVVIFNITHLFSLQNHTYPCS